MTIQNYIEYSIDNTLHIEKLLSDFYNLKLDNFSIPRDSFPLFLSEFCKYWENISYYNLVPQKIDTELILKTNCILLVRDPPYSIIDIIYEFISFYDLFHYSKNRLLIGFYSFNYLENNSENRSVRDRFKIHSERYFQYLFRILNGLITKAENSKFPRNSLSSLESIFSSIFEILQKKIALVGYKLEIPQNLNSDEAYEYISLKLRKHFTNYILASSIQTELYSISDYLYPIQECFNIKSQEINIIADKIEISFIKENKVIIKSPYLFGLAVLTFLDKRIIKFLSRNIPMYKNIKLTSLRNIKSLHKELIQSIIQTKNFKIIDIGNEKIGQIQKIIDQIETELYEAITINDIFEIMDKSKFDFLLNNHEKEKLSQYKKVGQESFNQLKNIILDTSISLHDKIWSCFPVMFISRNNSMSLFLDDVEAIRRLNNSFRNYLNIKTTYQQIRDKIFLILRPTDVNRLWNMIGLNKGLETVFQENKINIEMIKEKKLSQIGLNE